MRIPSKRVIVSLVIALISATALAGLAQAHERRDVGGKYQFVVGWNAEPAFAGQRNGVSLTVTNTQNNTPVEGIEKTLKLEIIQGAQKRELPLRAVFRQPGAYTADVVPTREGDYRFHFSGAIEGAAIDETFDSADGKFDGVKSPDAILFPGDAGSAAQPAAAAATVAAANNSSTAQTLAVVALVVAVLGLVLGLLALLRGRPSARGAGGEQSVTSQG